MEKWHSDEIFFVTYCAFWRRKIILEDLFNTSTPFLEPESKLIWWRWDLLFDILQELSSIFKTPSGQENFQALSSVSQRLSSKFLNIPSLKPLWRTRKHSTHVPNRSSTNPFYASNLVEIALLTHCLFNIVPFKPLTKVHFFNLLDSKFWIYHQPFQFYTTSFYNRWTTTSLEIDRTRGFYYFSCKRAYHRGLYALFNSNK